MSDVKVKDLYWCKADYLYEMFDKEYPWQILPEISETIKALIISGIYGFERYSDGILVGKNVKISKTATIIAPSIIGNNTEIRPCAYIRGNAIIGDNCIIGNSTEIKNSILLDNVSVPHYNYVGDSILGNGAHLGAGTVCSNLKTDKKEVIVHAGYEYTTGLRKVGAFVGDGVDVGCGCVLNPGTVIGKNTAVYPLVSLRGYYPQNSIVKSTDLVVSKKEI